ncbi:MAG: DUF327 family protein [Candidatus Cloacimonetes bacterium]|nr:DUF327 family protein [Candidatus Cloacimonadota bacterium]
MKIDSSSPKIVSKKDKKNSKTAKKTNSFFSSLFQPIQALEERPQENHFDYESIMDQLEEIGKELILKRNMGALKSYKERVRALIKEFSNKAHETSFLVGGSQSNDHNQLQISRVINDNLVDITNQIMGNEKSSVDLAATIDNIKGLLVDYMK